MVAAVSPISNPLVRRKVSSARVLNETPIEEATPSAPGESYHPASHAFTAMTVCASSDGVRTRPPPCRGRPPAALRRGAKSPISDVALDVARSRLLRPACDVPQFDDVAATPRSFAEVCLPCHRTVTG